MKSVTVTYEIVTPESAEHGDAAERGFYQPGGWHYPTPDGLVGEDFTRWCEETGNADPIKHDDIYEVARDAIYDGYGVEEGCDWLVWQGDELDAETEDGDAGTEQRHMHKGDDITDAEWALIVAWVKAGKVPDPDDE